MRHSRTVAVLPLPCSLDPDLWLQPGEKPAWGRHLTTRRAVAECRSCPRLRECARDALTAGTLEYELYPRPASGVVMAGVVCRGGDKADETRAQLLAVLGEDTPVSQRLACRRCERAFTGSGAVRHAAHGLCRGCYAAAYRSTDRIRTPSERPTHCRGCERPMRTKKAPRRADHVVHSGHGMCQSCHRAYLRAQQATAQVQTAA